MESYRIEDGDARTHVIEYYGKTHQHTPGPFELSGVDFGSLAIPMMEETPTSKAVLEFHPDVSHKIEADELEEVDIFFEEPDPVVRPPLRVRAELPVTEVYPDCGRAVEVARRIHVNR